MKGQNKKERQKKISNHKNDKRKLEAHLSLYPVSL
jgi:hypothetical protein